MPILYRHVDLQLERKLFPGDYDRVLEARRRQQQFARTLLSQPQYGKHVRVLKAALSIPTFQGFHNSVKDLISDGQCWRAMNLLTNVQSVEVGSACPLAYSMTLPTDQFPIDLYQSATSVRLVGRVSNNLATSILNAINPATLQDLCLDMIETAGLLSTLTGRCTTLRTLILRRIGEIRYGPGPYSEWRSFIDSVQGTVEKFTFEEAWGTLPERLSDPRFMDESFRRLVYPTIAPGNWPRLTILKLRGLRGPNDEGGSDALTKELRAVLGGQAKVMVEVVVYKSTPSSP